MTDAVETMAWTGQTPWHGLGHEVSNSLTPAQMLKAAELDWTVDKRQLMYQKNGSMAQVPGKFGLVRSTDEKVLSVVGSTYKPVQNETAMDFFRRFVKAGKMTMETAGSLWGGRHIWALARIGKDFKIGKSSDEVRGFLLLSQPHMIGRAMVIQFTPIRVVCWNTLTMAIGSDLKGKGNAFRMPHSVEFTEAVKKSAEVALGLATNQMEQFQEAATLLSKKSVKQPEVEEFFCEVLRFNPKDANKKKDGTIKEPRVLPKFRTALEHAPGQQLVTAKGTLWGALNAVTAVVDHEMGRERSTALKSAWLGSAARMKRRALELALKRAS